MDDENYESLFENLSVSRWIIDAFLKQRQLYQAAIHEVTTKLEILDEEFRVSHAYNPIHHIESRLKKPESILKKLERKHAPLTEAAIDECVQDIAGVRVICNYIEDVFAIADLFVGQSDVKLLRKRDYITSPKPNGYRSLHLIVSIPIFLSTGVKLIKVEVQIRTIAMDFWASLEHQLKYKAEDEISENLRERLAASADRIALIDQEMQAIHWELQKNWRTT